MNIIKAGLNEELEREKEELYDNKSALWFGFKPLKSLSPIYCSYEMRRDVSQGL